MLIPVFRMFAGTGFEGINPFMHDYIHIYLYIYKLRKIGYKTPFTLWSLFNIRPVSEWVASGNLGLNVTCTKTDERGMDITYQIPLYLFVFWLIFL